MKVETYLVKCECPRVYSYACTRVKHVRYTNQYACRGYYTRSYATKHMCRLSSGNVRVDVSLG